MSAGDVRIERGGWMANHPITGHPTHVVTREWFDEIRAADAHLKAHIQEVERALRAANNVLQWIGVNYPKALVACPCALYHKMRDSLLTEKEEASA